MAWFSRFTRFGDMHLVYGQEANMSCGIASILMCVFKINKLRPGADALKVEKEIYDLYSKASGGAYKPATHGTSATHLATMLNGLNCGKWKAAASSTSGLSQIIHKQVGVVGGFGPTVAVNPVIVGVKWNGSNDGHAIVIDTIRQVGGNLFATVCDPWDANVHVVPIHPNKPFTYEAGKAGFSKDAWGSHKGQKKPYGASDKGSGMVIIYRE